MPMRVLITGGRGMLGRDVAEAAAEVGHECVSLSHAELDITDLPEVRAAVMEAAPDAVINCAAWTDVDGAESASEAAANVNRDGAGHVARAADEVGAWTVHVSSDYVFDGTKRTPYVESDQTNPLSAYGRSKLGGEHAVAAAAPSSHTIVRSSWLFGIHGRCFPATILRLAGERDHLAVVDDQTGCPTFTGHLAPALIALAERRRHGIFHVAGAGACSWYELAREIVGLSGLDCVVERSTTAEQRRPAPRPAYSVLGSERRGEAPELPEWRRGLEAYMRVGSRS
jgi:dTDP-4-dehydrorhamnose reductase